MKSENHHIELLGVRIHNYTREEALERAAALLTEPVFHQVVTPGPEFLLEAQDHPKFKDILNQADLSLADGMGLHIGARLKKQSLRARVPGADFVLDLMRYAADNGYSVFLFGAGHGVGEAAAKNLLRQFPTLKIVGLESRYGNLWGRLQDKRIVEKIHLAKPDILLVALGAPKQELWIDQHRESLHDVRLAMGVGRTLDYLAGTVQRSPIWMRRLGLEWLHTWLSARQYHQPHQRRRRVWNATWHFLVHVLKSRTHA